MPQARSPLIVAGLVTACTVLGAIDVGLVLQNRALRARLSESSTLVQAAERSPRPAFEGSPFPPGKLRDLHGQEVSVSGLPEGTGTLLLVSAPGCDYCELARPVWEHVARLATDTPLRVFALVLEAAPAEAQEETGRANYPYEVLIPEDRGRALFQALPGVPAAILLDAHGRVVRTIPGGEQEGLEECVEQFLLGGE